MFARTVQREVNSEGVDQTAWILHSSLEDLFTNSILLTLLWISIRPCLCLSNKIC